MKAHCGKTISLEYSFASEAPDPSGRYQKQMLMLNSHPCPKVIFDDLLASWLKTGFGSGWSGLGFPCAYAYAYSCHISSYYWFIDWQSLLVLLVLLVLSTHCTHYPVVVTQLRKETTYEVGRTGSRLSVSQFHLWRCTQVDSSVRTRFLLLATWNVADASAAVALHLLASLTASLAGPELYEHCTQKTRPQHYRYVLNSANSLIVVELRDNIYIYHWYHHISW